jgi:TBC1 domain family protein 5
MPDHDYFRRPETQKMLLDVLFVFCKLSPDTGYRQGMHELLAPIVLVVERDAIEPRSLQRHRGSDGNDGLLRGILDASFVEHDVFTLFSLVMQTAKSFYELGESRQVGSRAPPSPSLSRSNAGQASQALSPIIERSQRIHHHYLQQVDPELAEHLSNIDILPQIFLM